MKNLANCTLKEFMVQTRLIKHHVEKWLKATDIMNIRRVMPDYPDGATDEEKRKLNSEQALRNISRIFDACFDEHPDETAELLALLCFVPAKEANDHPMTFYMQSVKEMIRCEEVWDFFDSLAELARSIGITLG